MKRKVREYSGSKTAEVSIREIENRKLARFAAAEGTVLMKNNGILPLKNDAKVFLCGKGAVQGVKGGTGSGDVNERQVVDFLTGLKNAGIEVVNEANVTDCINDYKEKMNDYRNEILALENEASGGSDMDFLGLLISKKPKEAKRPSITKAGLEKADAALFIISRISGEGFDRFTSEGDYFLSAEEKKDLDKLCQLSDRVVVVLNTGGQIDLKGIYDKDAVASILNISQGGMEFGNAFADVVTGKITPSGKLACTWAVDYEDFPGASSFSHNDGNLDKGYYDEGIFVGYRYFDSFNLKPAFPFGFGLSYTDFAITERKVLVKGNDVIVSARVSNIGNTYSGKEVLQVYVACPQGDLRKEFKRLVGFAKTELLDPGKSQELKIIFSAKDMASFDENLSAWVLDEGDYGIFLGNSSDNIKICGQLCVDSTTVIEEVSHILPLTEKLEEISPDEDFISELTANWKSEAEALSIKPIKYAPEPSRIPSFARTELDDIAEGLAERLTDEELTAMLMGEITKGQDNIKENELVETGIYVPGAAGETSCRLEKKYDIPAISMADGPAGIRVLRNYDVDKKTGKIYGRSLISSVNGGMFAPVHKNKNVDTYYMYATAIPIGTCLAQTFDTELVKRIGQMVGGEMVEFGVSWWLAPGMNIQKNPLCGRNFEYYSEDPFVAGMMAAAMTLGVQSVPGVGTTIKHFACNNQEDNRMGTNAIVSERALREIYVRGFELAIKKSQPMCIMTSYNLINGIHSANSYDLCTVLARQEWGFQGIIMTDWTTTTSGENHSKSHVCALAGNDLIMPGNQRDADDILSALRDGSLPRRTAREAAARIIKVIFQTIGMEEPEPYSKQFF